MGTKRVPLRGGAELMGAGRGLAVPAHTYELLPFRITYRTRGFPKEEGAPHTPSTEPQNRRGARENTGNSSAAGMWTPHCLSDRAGSGLPWTSASWVYKSGDDMPTSLSHCE